MGQKIITRRIFLKYISKFILSFSFIFFIIRNQFEGRVFAEERIAAELKKEFPYLIFTEDTVSKFTSDYQNYYHKNIQFPLTDDIKKLFILSTDFIQNGGLTKNVSYKMFYSPYDHICYNPFTSRAKTMFPEYYHDNTEEWF